MTPEQAPGGQAAGWYPDPTSPQLRWWDGQSWTDHVHPLVNPPAPGTSAAVGPAVATAASAPVLEVLLSTMPPISFPAWQWALTNGAHEIAQLSGKSPSRQTLQVLDDALLPGERVIAAIQGNSGLKLSWIFATPTLLFQLSDNGSIGWIGLDQVVGYEGVPAWSGFKLQVATTSGSYELSSVNERRVHPFVQGLSAACDAAPYALQPPSLQKASDALEEAASLLERSWHLGLQQHFGDVSAAAVLASDVVAGLSWAFRANGDMTSDQCLLLANLASFDPNALSMGRGAMVRRIVDAAPKDPLAALRLPRAAESLGGDVQAACIMGLASIFDGCAATVPLGGPTSQVRRFTELAARTRGLASR